MGQHEEVNIVVNLDQFVHLFPLYFSFLAKRGVKEDIQTFDARKISPEIRDGCEKLLAKNGSSFDPKVSFRFCLSCIFMSHSIFLGRMPKERLKLQLH